MNTSDTLHQPKPSTSSEAKPFSEASLWSFTGIELIDVSAELTLLLDSTSDKRLLVRKEVGIANSCERVFQQQTTRKNCPAEEAECGKI